MKLVRLKNQLLDQTEIQEIQSTISQKVLKGIQDKSIETILRKIIFNPNNIIDWDVAIGVVYENMPEIGMELEDEKVKDIDDRYESLKSICCECGCEVDLKEVYLTEEGEPICDKCK